MRKACDIGKRNKLDPLMRKYILAFAAVFAAAGLVAGFYAGLNFVSHEAALDAPLFEKFFLNTFIAISCGAAGLIFGAFVGSTVYRFKEKSQKQ